MSHTGLLDNPHSLQYLSDISLSCASAPLTSILSSILSPPATSCSLHIILIIHPSYYSSHHISHSVSVKSGEEEERGRGGEEEERRGGGEEEVRRRGGENERRGGEEEVRRRGGGEEVRRRGEEEERRVVEEERRRGVS